MIELPMPTSSLAKALQGENTRMETRAIIERLKPMWCEVLHVEDIGLDEDFFRLGGDSMAAVALMLHVEETFDISLDAVEIFEAATLEKFAAVVARVIESPSSAIRESAF